MAEEQPVPPPTEPNNGNDSDQDFDPTAEMMVDDFDDERTMAEEEELEGADEEEDDELELLKNEQDVPIDKLKELFGYSGDQPPPVAQLESASDDDTDHDEDGSKADSPKDVGVDDELDAKDEKEKDFKDKKESTHKLLTRTRTAKLLSSSRGTSQISTDDEEEDDLNGADDIRWKKTIQVGSNFQADIPESFTKYDDAMPYENEDVLQWVPGKVDDPIIIEFYEKWQEAANVGYNPDIPMGNHVRDDERALWLLYQCGFKTDEALRRQKLGASQGGSAAFVNGDCDMTPWSEEECRNFEAGLRLHGKDFFTIKTNKLSTRSVKELVNFYYLWKKTERHDVFTTRTRLEKKKYSLHPGTTDYMDKFLDEQEALISRSSSPGEGSKAAAAAAAASISTATTTVATAASNSSAAAPASLSSAVTTASCSSTLTSNTTNSSTAAGVKNDVGGNNNTLPSAPSSISSPQPLPTVT